VARVRRTHDCRTYTRRALRVDAVRSSCDVVAQRLCI
jgi:hypothetical protein